MDFRGADVHHLVQARLSQLMTGRQQTPDFDEMDVHLVDPPLSSVRPIASMGVGLVLVLAVFAWTHRAQPAPAQQTFSAGVSLVSPTLSSEIVVDVEGEVNKPGLVKLPVGSRIADAIAAADGIKPGTENSTVNLAARLEDGQLIVVGSSSDDAAQQDSRVSLNQGTVADFDSLPGVGPVLAARIVSYRDQHNHFSSVDQLQEVPGIGPKVFANLKPLIKL
mgnify:CR=1 FL=1